MRKYSDKTCVTGGKGEEGRGRSGEGMFGFEGSLDVSGGGLGDEGDEGIWDGYMKASKRLKPEVNPFFLMVDGWRGVKPDKSKFEARKVIEAFLKTPANQKFTSGQNFTPRSQIPLGQLQNYKFYLERRTSRYLWVIELATYLKLGARTIQLIIYYSDCVALRRYLTAEEMAITV
jgi:hypothetical protein